MSMSENELKRKNQQLKKQIKEFIYPEKTNDLPICSLCGDHTNHDIQDCPMNCCGTSDGSCLR